MDTRDVSNAFAEDFAKISKRSENSLGFHIRRRADQPRLKSFYRRILQPPKEFENALSSCDDTAPGPDEIPYAMLKHASYTKNPILGLINRIWKKVSTLMFGK